VQKWGKRDVRGISKEDVLSILDGIVKKGYPSAANHAFRQVRKLFNWGVERGIVETSPCQGLKEPSKSVKRDRVLAKGELIAIWEAAHEMGYPYGHIIKLLILTGQRREEVAGMRWDELDLTHNIWTIARDRNKSDREHSVPLSPQVMQIIKSIPQTNDTLVFPARGTDKQVSGFSKWKKKIDELSNTSGWTVHDLRRTVATELAGLNVQPHVIERVLNHSNGILGGVAGIYNRFGYQDEMREALNLWADTVNEITK
jgi:integrase